MLESRYLEGKAIAGFDNLITDALKEISMEGGGKTMNLGIENEDGEVYRVIFATGMGAYVQASETLKSLGLRDELVENPFGINGLDGLYRVTEAFTAYLKAEAIKQPSPSLIEDLKKADSALQQVEETERESLIQSRLGQGMFRQKLIEYWQGCAVSDCTFVPLLRASHIKPWRESTNEERLDVYNGLLLSPNLDAAFDQGYISFDMTGRILLSKHIKGPDAYALRITPKLKIKPKRLNQAHHNYFEYHREQVFKGE